MTLKKEVLEKDLYAELGVSSDAPRAEIRAKYTELARKWHPDKIGKTEENNAQFRAVQEAWEVLGDEDTRKEYDLNRIAKAGPDEIVRGMKPEDPFDDDLSDGMNGSENTPESPNYGPYPLSATSMEESISRMTQKVTSLQHDLELSVKDFTRCEERLVAAYDRRQPGSGRLYWRISLERAEVAIYHLWWQSKSLKIMLPVASPDGKYEIDRVEVGTLLKKLERLTSAWFLTFLALTAIGRFIRDSNKGHDMDAEIEEQLHNIVIAAKPK